jgi:hypothetical protein
MRKTVIKDRHIRCRCGKFWGMKNFRMNRECKRCNEKVIARGPLGNKK